MLRKASAMILALCMIAAFAVTAGADEDNYVDGIYIRGSGGGEFCDAFIDTKAVGFVVGQSYTIEYDVQVWDVGNIRVRYSNWDGEGGWTDAANDGAGHSTDAATTTTTKATQIPAFFAPIGLSENSKGIVTVDFTFGADAEGAFANMDNTQYIGFFGGGGYSDYEVLGVRIKNASGAVIASAGTLFTAPVVETPPAGNTDEAPPAGNTAVSEDEKGGGETGLAPIAAVIGIAAVATTGVIVSVKKRK